MSDHSAMLERTEQMPSSIYGEIVPIAAIQQNIARVQAAKATVMKKGVHWGEIPGVKGDTLFKPGAEVINLMFGVSVDPDALALTEHEGVDEVGVAFYRVTVRMIFKTRGGVFLGASYGYASTLEEKYKWRRATGPKEFEATPDGRRRVKFRRGANSEYEEDQVRTEVEDLRNTILQMAMKRGEVSGTRRVHALSAMFKQDLEDMPPEILASIVDGEVVASERTPVQAAQRKSEQTNGASADTATPTAPTTTAVTGDKPHVGKIASVDERAGKSPYWFVVLATGFKTATWDAKLADEARKQHTAGAVVELAFKPSDDPRYAPKLTSITVVGA